MEFETNGSRCIEIMFAVNGSEKFDECWMGKMPDRKTKEDVFWFGLTADGKNAYDYSTFEDYSSAKVFDGKSLFEIWDNITIYEIDGCDPMEMVEMYLSGYCSFGDPQW
jgi:hypothetical protein